MSVSEVYLSINKKEFDKVKEKAFKENEEAGCDEEGYMFPDLTLEKMEFIFDGDTLDISGDLGDLGYLSIEIPMSTDNAIHFIEEYVKKMNKIKTILEAAK